MLDVTPSREITSDSLVIKEFSNTILPKDFTAKIIFVPSVRLQLVACHKSLEVKII